MRVIDPTVEWTADAVGLVQRLYLRNQFHKACLLEYMAKLVSGIS